MKEGEKGGGWGVLDWRGGSKKTRRLVHTFFTTNRL